MSYSGPDSGLNSLDRYLEGVGTGDSRMQTHRPITDVDEQEERDEWDKKNTCDPYE